MKNKPHLPHVFFAFLTLSWFFMVFILYSGGIHLRSIGIDLGIHRIEKPLVIYSFILLIIFIISLSKRRWTILSKRILTADIPDEDKSSSVLEIFFREILLFSMIFLIITQLVLFHYNVSLSVSGPLSLLLYLGVRLRPVISKLRHSAMSLREKIFFHFKNFPIVHRSELLVSGVIIIQLFMLWFPAHPWFLGGRDPGVYINAAAMAAKEHSILHEDPLLASMNPGEYHLFGPVPKHSFYQSPLWKFIISLCPCGSEKSFHGTKFPGFYILNPTQGQVLPQFFPLYTAVLASSMQLFGIERGPSITPIIASLSLLAFYYLCCGLFGRTFSLFATILLSVNVAQYWYSKTPNTEILFQFVFFSALYFSLLYFRHKSPFWAVFSGLSTGLLFYIRIDAAFLAPLLVIFFFFQRRGKNAFSPVFWITLLVTASGAAVNALCIATPYSHDIFQLYFPHMTAAKGIILLFIGCTMVILSRILLKFLRRHQGLWWRVSPFIVLGFYLMVLYFLVVRSSGVDRWSESYNIVKLSWYCTPVTFILGLVGVGILLKRMNRLPFSLMLFPFLLYCLYYLPHAHFIYNDHFWWVRRYVPVIIPTVMMGAAFLLTKMVRQDIVMKYLGLGLFGFCLIQSLNQGHYLWDHSEYGGMLHDLQVISEKVGERDVLLFPHVYYGIETPLHFILGKKVVILNFEQKVSASDLTLVMRRFRKWHREKRKIFALYAPGRTLHGLQRCTVTDLGRFDITFKEAARPLESVPQSLNYRTKSFRLASIIPYSGAKIHADERQKFTVDNDDKIGVVR